MYFLNNAGGWNKSHEQVEKTPRIDSFETSSLYGTGCIWCGHGLIQAHKADERSVLLHLKCRDQRVSLSYSTNGFGGQQTFFLCPECGKRVRYLYLTQGFLCRTCAKLNYRSQQQTRDSMTYYHKGMEYAKKHLSLPPADLDVFSFCAWIPDRPRGMRQTTYRKHLERFLRYQRRHEARTLADLMRIIGKVEINRLMREQKREQPRNGGKYG